MSCTLYLIYSRLCWCLILILILVFSSALTWLTHIILVVLFLGCLIYMLLNHMFVANARLLLLSMFACNCCVFLLILGEWWSYFVHLYPNKKNLNCAQIMGSFSIFLRTLLFPNRSIHLSFWLIGSFDCLLHFVLCKWDQFVPCALCHVPCYYD